MTKPSIVVPAISQWVEEGREAVQALRDVDQKVDQLEKALVTSREAAQMRRIELGKILMKVRASLPKRGDRETGWRAYLEAIEVGPTSAWRYMNEAGAVFQEGEVERMGAQPSEYTPADDRDTPAPSDKDAPREADDEATDDDIEIDRDTWCTPLEWAEAVGPVDLDPCANERSHVQARVQFDLDLRGEDGLVKASEIGKSWRTFLNPPYSNVMPWVEAYAHTRFIYLLKLDPSTKWFAKLMEKTRLILIPRGTRIQFEAPEGVPPEKALANQFPHAFFFANEEDATPELLERCFVWRVES